jgi:hypothetical protein
MSENPQNHRRFALPVWTQIWWCASLPLAIALSARLLWEKTVWTWTRGPQMVGFSLMHIHPGFAVLGFFSTFVLALWVLPAVAYLVIRRKDIHLLDVGMLLLALLIIASIAMPDNFFV